jgi:ethanolamine ammonia-lyase small subunit
LATASYSQLQALAQPPCDVALIVSNGLSSTAIEQHGLALLQTLYPRFTALDWRCSPICLVPNARVALSDVIGGLLQARLTVMVIGERPGLSAADSVGIYMTYHPAPGNTDAERNCLSNIRPPQGMSYQQAADKLLYLSQQAMERGYSGVALKDDMETDGLPAPATLLEPAVQKQLQQD